MGEAVKKLEVSTFGYSNKSTSERVKETHTTELVIGICSQIGAKKNLIITNLKKELKEYGYQIKTIKLSSFIEGDLKVSLDEIENQYEGKTKGFINHIRKIKKGNKLREKFENDYLANLAISEIANQKKEKFNIKDESDFSNVKPQRVCYIIDSIKHKEELEVLRDVYSEVFYLIGIFTPKKERINNVSSTNLSLLEAKELIKIDAYQETNSNGQQVRDVFVESDFFIKVDKSNENDVSKKVERFVNLIFQNEIITPSIEERAMYEAQSASVNSACLSRQVGASIISGEELLSVGWNDVPKYGGNLYTSESKIDNRCYIKGGKCFNDSNKKNIRDVIENSFKEKVDNSELDNKNEAIKLLREVLLDSSIKTLIEFSRSVHAEMHAILNAASLFGEKLKKSTLFCTTYPCHNCVRHIIAAGITKLYYIEPYVKSKGVDLHSDAITDDSDLDENNEEKVQILMFEGVSPKKYVSFFKKSRKRKNKITGETLCNSRNKHELFPVNSISLQTLFYREVLASKRIDDKNKIIENGKQ
ncbi:anti-phage dCTP deaminase [Polaribacter sp. Asnod6-C07]|uniref:anti-phage dCTP deaminase n=1 Tax=Polaribacter sp. Asnod6-C07 TaxID=3160582 RepID=UPI003869507C